MATKVSSKRALKNGKATLISDIHQADDALRRIKTAEIELDEITVNLNKAQLESIGSVSSRVLELVDEITVLGNRLVKYGEDNKDFLFTNKKSFTLPHGKLKFSEGRARIVCSERTLKTLQDLKMKEAIRTFEPQVNLDVLGTYDDDTLQKVGASREKSESFGYETTKVDPRKIK